MNVHCGATDQHNPHAHGNLEWCDGSAPEPADQTRADVVLSEGDQPDGIDPQGSDLPSAKAAVLQDFGDGIVLGGGEGDLPQLPALYARDLEVLRRAALGGER